MRKTRPKIQTDSPPPPIPKGKSVAQCFNYCWVYFQLMHIQQLEPRLESKGLRQRLGEPLQGWPHTHTHTHIIWCLNWTFQLQSPVLLHLLQSHGCFFPAPVLCSAQICVAGWGSQDVPARAQGGWAGGDTGEGDGEWGTRYLLLCVQPRCSQWALSSAPCTQRGCAGGQGTEKGR